VILNGKLEKKDYQEIYIDLNSASVAATRVFIEDLGADGLKSDHPTAWPSIRSTRRQADRVRQRLEEGQKLTTNSTRSCSPTRMPCTRGCSRP